MVRPVIHSKKHYVQLSLSAVTGGTVLTEEIVKSVENPTALDTVEEGTLVKAIYCEYWVRGGAADASGQAIIYKKTGDTTNPSATDMAALGDWDNKKNILYTTMGLFNDPDENAIAIYKGWLKIPKGKQRMGLGDNINLSIFAPVVALDICGFATYKEYS